MLYTSDEQTVAWGHTFDEKLDGVCRITLIVGMNDTNSYRDYQEMLKYEYFSGSHEKFIEHIEKGLTEKEIVKLGKYTKLLEAVLREG